MKRIVSGLMIVVWLASIIGGCQTKSPSGADQSKDSGKPDLTTAPPDLEATIAEFDLSVANVEVKGFSFDPEQRKVCINVRFAWIGGEVTYNVITVSSHTSDNTWDGASVRLGDENGNLLWEYVLDWDANDTTWMRITEQTGSDTLSIKKFLPIGSTATEVYTFNGTQMSVTLPLFFHDYLQNPTAFRLTAEDQALLQQTQAEFLTFYGTGNSLSENRYGIILTQMLVADGFRSWLATHISTSLFKTVPNRTALADSETVKDWICVIAAVCSYKCPWTTLVNPLCVPCIGIGLACLIAEIVELLQR